MNYFETERGRFDVNLVRSDEDGNIVVAYCDPDGVHITSDYIPGDRNAVEEFASWYDSEIIWEEKE